MRRALLLAAGALAAGAAGAPAQSDDPLCTGSYGGAPAQAGPPLRFGIDSELAGSAGVGQAQSVPLDRPRGLAALRRLTPAGKQMVLRVNRLFWSEGEQGIARFRAILDRQGAAGFDSEIQVRYHPAPADVGDMAKWEAYVREVVRRLGADRRVVSMTITNEANLNISQNTSDGAYAGAVDALLRGVVAAREEADRIGRADLALGFTYAYRWNPRSDAAFFSALAAGGERFRRALDFVGVDVYPGTFYPPVVSPLSSPGQEVVKAIATVRDCYMPKAGLGRDTAIWISENGEDSGSQGDDAAQAAALGDMVSAVAATSGTYGVTDYRWFNLRDNATGSPQPFYTSGLLRDDYSEKPSLARYRALVAALGADRPPPCVTRVTVTLPRRARRVVARVDGRRVRGWRRGRRLTIALRRAGVHRVTVSARTRSGRRVTIRRTARACAPVRARAAAARGRTVVSLEFDVATADQAKALPLLRRYGMKATFFVNSGLIGEPRHLTWAQLRAIQAAGHEIAGQTIDHARLTRLPPARVRRQVCVDRARLLANGLAADAFAYPFGAYSDRVRDVVVSCGYSSARLASGIAGAGRCPGCPYAETLPPRNRFATRMPPGVRRTTTVARLAAGIRAARRDGGGWVQLLVHHVCNGCHPYSIPRWRLAKLLRWLAREPGVQVRTVAQLLDAGGPTVRVRTPRAIGAGWTTLRVRYRAPRGVRRVRWFVDGRQVGVRTIAPWRLRWFPTRLRPGPHEVRALLEDRRANAAASPPATVVRG